ncbi:MAG: transposase [Candidatus Aenigmarchaeota archaeon]|nr:transposase [Candidatus Aenigmarchaeota archaeon]
MVHYKKKLLIVLDNNNSHKGKLIKEFAVRKMKTLKLIFLPPYSPELNPMELRVKESKKALSNKLYINTDAMKKDLIKKYKKREFFTHKMFEYLCPYSKPMK